MVDYAAYSNVRDQWLYTTAGTTVATLYSVWNEWATTAVTNPTQITTWKTWTYEGTGAWPVRQVALPAPVPVDQARIDREREELRARLEQHAREQKEATERAHAILLEHLTPEQRAAYETGRAFRVVGEHSKATYRIDFGIAGNVYRLDKAGRPRDRFCIHPAGLPAEDVMLAQKLLLETDEAAFVRIANRSAA